MNGFGVRPIGKDFEMARTDQCLTCKHYRGILVCNAYPQGIPEVVIRGLFDHRKPCPGDQGIRWEPRDETILPEND